MDFLIWLLFESTVALAGGLFVVLFVLLVHWRRTLRPRAFLIGLAVSLVLLIVQSLVVTRKEHADRIMQRVEVDIVASRVDALAAALSDRFHIAEMNWDRAKFIDVVEGYMSWIDVLSLTRRRLEIVSSTGEHFQIYVSYLADVSTNDFRYTGLSRWLIEFVRAENGWQVTSIQPTEMDQRRISGWRSLPRR
jgi:hypothetical protein